MLKRGYRFEFEVPDDWQEERAKNQSIFHGHDKEELIVSGFLIRGSGSDQELQKVRRSLFEGAVNAVEEAVAHPDLEVIKPLGRDPTIAQVECWTLDARTRSGNLMFSQAIVVDTGGVLLITFEAPRTVECATDYGRFLKSIRAEGEVTDLPKPRTSSIPPVKR